MENWQDRTTALIGNESVNRLNSSKVFVFGIGGVGGHVVEALCRAGVGEFVLVDKDEVSITNINRQIIATSDTVGKYKTEVMQERIKSINPEAKVTCINEFYLPENADTIDFSDADYVIDAVDTVTAKIEIIRRAKLADVPVISSMGTGNKLDVSKFKVADISKTSVCPLAKVMRKELKERGIFGVKVLYSTEEPLKTDLGRTPASISYVPACGGLMIAGEVIKDLIGYEPER